MSSKNHHVKYLRRLTKRHFREQEGKFFVEGVRFVEEALNSSFIPEMIAYTPKIWGNNRGAALLGIAADKGLPCFELNDTLFKELTETVTPQGILAVMRRRWGQLYDIPKITTPWLLVLVDGVQDPGNLGSIVRSADASDAHGVILLKGTTDIFNAKCLRATMGSIFHIPVIQNISFSNAVLFFREQGIKLVAGTPRSGKAIYNSNLTGSCVLLVGSEANGPSARVLSEVHEHVHIPMPGQAESMNVAVSSAIMLYETIRQRQLDI